MIQAMRKTLSQRFWAKVNPDGPVPKHRPELGKCWVWTAYIGQRGTGYGIIRAWGQPKGAHCVSWVIHNGEVPAGLFVLHKCDNKRCVNPVHLFLGTHQDNSDDMRAKGRSRYPHGEATSNAKLTAEKVRQIRELFCHGEVTHKMLAERYGVSEETIQPIIAGRTWKQAGGPMGIKKNHRRWIWGEQHQDAKLKEPEVLEIRRRAASGEQGYKIAEDYPQVSRCTVYSVINGVTWKHTSAQIKLPMR